MRVLSHEPTALAYDGVSYRDGLAVAPKRPGKVVIHPGYNTVSPEGVDLLDADPNFARAVNAGILVVNPEGDVQAIDAEEFFEVVEDTPADPRAKFEGETDKAYKARLKKLDDAAAAADKPRLDFLATFNGLDAAAKDASYPSLTVEQKAWVDADRAGKGA